MSDPSDIFERAAEANADTVMSGQHNDTNGTGGGDGHSVQREAQLEEEEEEPLQGLWLRARRQDSRGGRGAGAGSVGVTGDRLFRPGTEDCPAQGRGADDRRCLDVDRLAVHPRFVEATGRATFDALVQRHRHAHGHLRPSRPRFQHRHSLSSVLPAQSSAQGRASKGAPGTMMGHPASTLFARKGR